jgi:endoglucanase
VQRQNAPGTAIKADPGGNYQATVAKSVADATAAGFFVILDLHLSAPGDACPMIQNAMADADHSIAFWTSLATAFKGSSNVLFELFNEPFLDQSSLEKSDPWTALLDGNGTLRSYRVPGTPDTIDYTWRNAGMQQMLNAVRATGATNVILTSTLAYSSAMGGWLQYHPTDTLSPSQVGAAWHAYPGSTKYPAQVNCVGLPGCSAQTMAAVQAILAAGYPVVLSEFGDPVGGSAAPMSALVLPFADTIGISYLAWTWNVWPGTTFHLISDSSGTPTAGFGTYVKAHYLCRAAGTANCP